MVESQTAQLKFDGACSGNPGPAGYGVVLDLGDEVVTDQGYIGEATNNRAEYQGLIAGLRLARDHGVRTLTVLGDSQLVIKQMTGEYNVNNEQLRRLHSRATTLAESFDEIDSEWIRRENTGRADELARQARDK